MHFSLKTNTEYIGRSVIRIVVVVIVFVVDVKVHLIDSLGSLIMWRVLILVKLWHASYQLIP